MTAQHLGDFDANSPEWHNLRTTGIGASEIAAVVGLSPFESAFSLWHRKRGNLAGPDPSDERFYWGHALEPLVADKFAAIHPEFSVGTAGTYAGQGRRWQLANVDRVLRDRSGALSLLEIKTTRYGDNWGPDGSDRIPLHVRCQVMQQMDVFEVPFAFVAVLIGGNEYREYVIDYDVDDALALREAGAAFWESLQVGDEPPIDASFETYAAVRELHPDIDPDLDVPVDPALYGRYVTTKADADSATAAHRQAKSELLTAMGNARRALVNETPVLRRQPSRNGVALYPIKESA